MTNTSTLFTLLHYLKHPPVAASPVTVRAMSCNDELESGQTAHRHSGRPGGELEEALLVLGGHVVHQLPERLNDGRLAAVAAIVLG